MASTYTTNSGIEKIGAGEQAGAWGSETVTGGAGVAVTLAGMEMSAGTLAITGDSVLSFTGLEATGGTGEE